MLENGSQLVRRTKKDMCKATSNMVIQLQVLLKFLYVKGWRCTPNMPYTICAHPIIFKVYALRGSRKLNGTHRFILVRSQLWGMRFFLLHRHFLIEVTDNKRRVIPVLQDLMNVSLDFEEHFNTFISYKTLLDFFVKGFFHRYFFALHKEILVNFTN